MVFKGKYDQIILLAQAKQNSSEKLGFEKTSMNITNTKNVNRHMINAYGLISYQGIEYSANMNISNQQTRYAQDNMMLYQ